MALERLRAPNSENGLDFYKDYAASHHADTAPADSGVSQGFSFPYRRVFTYCAEGLAQVDKKRRYV